MLSLNGNYDKRKIILPVAVMGSDDPFDITHVKVRALLDTGATCSPVCPNIVDKLNLNSYEKRVVKVATEDRKKDFYTFRVGLFPDNNSSNNSSLDIPFIFPDTSGFMLQPSQDFDMIIGMDILSQCDFNMTRYGNWCLSFG